MESSELKKFIDDLLDQERHTEVKVLLDKEFEQLKGLPKMDYRRLADIAGAYIDLGNESISQSEVEIGIKIFQQYRNDLLHFVTQESIDYNLGNGFHALYKIYRMSTEDFFPTLQVVKDYLFEAKRSYFSAYRALKGDSSQDFTLMLFTNLGNSLNHNGRIVEAMQLFDSVLTSNPNFHHAIISKLDILMYLVILGECQISKSILYCIYRLYIDVFKYDMSEIVHNKIENKYSEIEKIVSANNIDLWSTQDDSHQNYIEYLNHSMVDKFYLQNFLYLSEHSLYCGCNEAVKDDIEIRTNSIAESSISKSHEAILERVKEEFKFARQLLWEYSNSLNEKNKTPPKIKKSDQIKVNLEKIRTSFRLCFGVLDKIAIGICLLCEIEVDKNNIYFESFWNNRQGNSSIWKKLNSFQNIHLTALFSIANDLNKNDGQFGYYKEWRNKIEHGIFIIADDHSEKCDSSIISVDSLHFYNETIHLLQIIRAAIFSYVYCVRRELKK